MKTLTGIMSVCLGCYFAAYSGRLIILRSAGHTSLFKLLDTVVGYLPYASLAILLLAGIISVLKNLASQPRAFLTKLLFVLVIAVIPVGVHAAMYSLTYSTGPPTSPRMVGSLTMSEWLIFLAGFVLVAMGLFLFWRSRNAMMTVHHQA